MSTPRQIKASEVRKGMRVRVERNHPEIGPRLAHTVVFEGVVSDATAQRFTIFKGSVNDYTFWNDSKVPTTITVLADPEPEWVEGAWYWVELQEKRTLMRRVGRGWSALADTEYAFYSDNNVTVLGRVLIVDWPGDDMAQDLVEAFSGNRDDFAFPANRMAVKIADAIRNQGGVR